MPVGDSRESSCSTESSLAEQEFTEIQEQQARDRSFNKTNIDHSSALSAMRMESNTRLALFTVPPTPPTSKSEAMKLLEQLQIISTNLVDIGKAQVEISGKYMQCLRASRLLRNKLDTVGVTRDSHGLLYANQDEMIRAVAKMGCNRALRIFERQSVANTNKAKKPLSRVENVLKTHEKPARKPRAKKTPPLPLASQEDLALTQFK
jgi:hypothetical protein